MTWESRANCGDTPPGTMFPEDEADEPLVAALVCAGCPVINSCAIAGKYERWGVWGGLTAKERRALRRRPTS